MFEEKHMVLRWEPYIYHIPEDIVVVRMGEIPAENFSYFDFII
jgi:hypothetical protein